MSATKRILKSLMTDRDNETQDVVKWIGVIGFLVGMGLQIYVVVVKEQTFDLTTYGLGMVGLLGGLAGAMRWKDPVTPAAPIITAATPVNVDKTTTTIESTTTSTATGPGASQT